MMDERKTTVSIGIDAFRQRITAVLFLLFSSWTLFILLNAVTGVVMERAAFISAILMQILSLFLCIRWLLLPMAFDIYEEGICWSKNFVFMPRTIIKFDEIVNITWESYGETPPGFRPQKVVYIYTKKGKYNVPAYWDSEKAYQKIYAAWNTYKKSHPIKSVPSMSTV